MTLRRPSQEDLLDLSDRHHLNITESELTDLHELIGGVMEGYDVLDQYPDPVREVIPAVRIPGRRPEPEEDPLNGVVRYCDVHATDSKKGPLSGKTIGLKDTISISTYLSLGILRFLAFSLIFASAWVPIANDFDFFLSLENPLADESFNSIPLIASIMTSA